MQGTGMVPETGWRIMRKILIMAAIVLLFVAGSTYVEAKQNFKDKIKLEQGYGLSVDNIDIWSSPRTATLQLTIHNDVVDEQVVPAGTSFNLYNGAALIAQGELRSVFSGAHYNVIEIRNLTQYDQVTGEVILHKEKIILGKRVR